MKLHRYYSSIAFILLTLVLIFAGQVLADNIDAKLPDNDNTSSFQVKDSDDNVLMKVQSGGNVGIGTTSPSASYKLTVDGDGSSYGIYVRNVGDTGIESDGYNYGLRASGRSRAVQGTTTDGHAIHGESTNGFAGYFVGNGYISGNVGIGTTSPAYKLDVEGNVQANAYYTGDIFFQKDGHELWRMFEDEEGLYLENLKTGKVSKILLEDDIIALKKEIKDELRKEILAELN